MLDAAESEPVVERAANTAELGRALEHALDRIQCGVILTSTTRRPFFVNAHARVVLEQRDSLRIVDGVLHARTPNETHLLQRALDGQAAPTGASTRTVAIGTSDLTRKLSVHVLPLPEQSRERPNALMFVCDPRITPAVSQASLRALFGLTRAEAVLAELLIQGCSLETAAHRLCVSVHTVRTHMKRILLKTDTGRQGELLRVMFWCAAVVVLD